MWRSGTPCSILRFPAPRVNVSFIRFQRCMPSSHHPSAPGSASEGDADRLTIAIIDDHPPIREAMRRGAEERMGMRVVAEASSTEEAFPLIQEHSPNVAIVDLSLSDGQAFGLIEALQAECPDTDLLVFSVYDETVYAERALRAGASGYLMKAASTAEVLRATRRVAEAGVYLSPEMATRALRGAQRGQAEKIRFPIDDLTDRQLQVFQMLGQGLSIETIANRLGLARKTVETHRRLAKEKLGYENIDDVILHAARWVQAGGRGERH